MIPTIGLLMCAYVAFRAIEAMVNVMPGGAYDELDSGAQGAIVLFGLLLLGVAVLCGASLLQSSQNATAALAPLLGETGLLKP
jgi:hypothetical protein